MKTTQPICRLLPVRSTVPSLQDNTGDIDRLKKALHRHLDNRWPIVPFDKISAVAEKFRRSHFNGYAVVNDLPSGPILVDFLSVEPEILPGLALDLGTTHLEATLIDLLSGKILARHTTPNPQTEYGTDILTRIHFATKEDGLEILHRSIIAGINDLTALLADTASIATQAIRAISVSGNTSMIHFFLKLSPFHLCREPYIPMINLPDPCRAGDLHLVLDPHAVVWILPSVGSYFGGDLISGILASGMDESDKTVMLIDVGTNAEVVVGNREWLVACAGAAGPALEGGVARMGVQAGPGAIDHISIDPETQEIHYTTIGGGPATGICGSGMIDLVAGLYLARIIDARGRFRNDAQKNCQHIVGHGGEISFRVAKKEETASGETILLNQIDLDALTRSKAAMYTILTTLTGQVGLTFADLDAIYVAGAFGKHISPHQAVTIGMLPDLPITLYKSIGNSSLAGAQQILMDKEARTRSIDIVRRITYIELNVTHEFMNKFSGAKFIPHTDRTLFPSVPFFQNP